MNPLTTRGRGLMRASEAARMLAISPEHLRVLVHEGKLEAVRIGEHGWWRFRVEDVERLIAGERKAP